MPDTNMDVKKNKDATSPVFEFTLPNSELESVFKVGEKGEVIIPVEVVSADSTSTTFRKIMSARTDKHFQAESAMDMRDRIGVVKNIEGSDNGPSSKPNK